MKDLLYQGKIQEADLLLLNGATPRFKKYILYIKKENEYLK